MCVVNKLLHFLFKIIYERAGFHDTAKAKNTKRIFLLSAQSCKMSLLYFKRFPQY